MIAKDVLALLSEGNKLTNDLFLNKWLEAAPGFFGTLYEGVREHPAPQIQKIMEASNYTEELLNEFLTLINKDYVEFDQTRLDEINQLHDRYKKSKPLQFLRSAYGDKTLELKEGLKNGANQIDKAKAIFKHMKAKDSDYAVVLMDYFLTAKLFRPSEAFRQLHAKITRIIKRDIPIDTFFSAMIHGIKKAKELFVKIENNESELDGEMITSYHQDHMTDAKYEHELDKLRKDNDQALKKLEIDQAHQLTVLAKQQEFELKKEMMNKEHALKKAAITEAKDGSKDKENAEGTQKTDKGMAGLIIQQRRALTQSQNAQDPSPGKV